MPKEQINYVSETMHDGTSSCAEVAVHWTNAATESPTAVKLRVVMNTDFLRLLINSAGSPNDPTPVLTPALSRKEINNFIRVLRKARDQAYGRDE